MHGQTTQATVTNSVTMNPINGIWCARGLPIRCGAYFPYKALTPKTLWIDVSFKTAFPHNIPIIIRPAMRYFQCKDPRCVDNFNQR